MKYTKEDFDRQLHDIEKLKDEWRDKAIKANEELEKVRDELLHSTRRAGIAEEAMNKTLLEIIRWLIQPDTASDPWNNIARKKNELPRTLTAHSNPHHWLSTRACEIVLEEVREKVERIKLDMDVVVCDCGEPYRDSDVAVHVDELYSLLTPNNQDTPCNPDKTE